jgi:fatty acid elongase 3
MMDIAKFQERVEAFAGENPEIVKLSQSYELAVVASSLYVVSVLIYKAFYEPEKGVKVQRAAWVKPVSVIHYGFLALLSLAMCVGMGGAVLRVCEQHGFAQCIDIHSQKQDNPIADLYSGASAFWMFIFAVSKFYEFIDTWLMMAKGYNIIFLHWWHHATVPILVAIHHDEQGTSAWSGSWINTLVHTVMYTYYACSAAGISVPLKPLITSFQITQFVVVLVHTGYIQSVHGWDRFPVTFLSCYTIYASYLLLFINFFIRTYLVDGKKKKTQ